MLNHQLKKRFRLNNKFLTYLEKVGYAHLFFMLNIVNLNNEKTFISFRSINLYKQNLHNERS